MLNVDIEAKTRGPNIKTIDDESIEFITKKLIVVDKEIIPIVEAKSKYVSFVKEIIFAKEPTKITIKELSVQNEKTMYVVEVEATTTTQRRNPSL